MYNKFFQTTEFYLIVIISLLFLTIGSQNSAFFSINNLFDLIRSGIVPGVFVVCALIVLVSGGIDVSFPAIAAFSMFTTTTILSEAGFNGPIIVPFLIGGAIGLILGIINAVFIALFKLPTLIVTLGTSSLFSGFLLTFIGSSQISNLPTSMLNFSKMQILKFTDETGIVVGLPISVLVTAGIVILVSLLLKYTMIGRSIYAFGGDPASAERIGFSPVFIQFFVYSFVGMLSGIAGIMHTSMMRNSNPVDLMGSELLIIAAVVLGGTRISGGHGTIKGALLGLLLVITIQNSLILMGIPSYWQRFVIGGLILIGTGLTAVQVKKTNAKRKSILT
ncbi:sugar ABC transporter permease [Paenibacillus sp. FSL R5-0490]|uniref:ABC transporter permease n=1 Tax=Paenibacillus sp. FSL R5-0490 TaxID=1920424 RepID=UPI00096D8A8D|nr:ABC transporter permease [Paenibacillus sp. FSL R5-0490]OMF59332.1 sugar ABC transporter permease [Paenibacillus sp. FSL R5-0490]